MLTTQMYYFLSEFTLNFKDIAFGLEGEFVSKNSLTEDLQHVQVIEFIAYWLYTVSCNTVKPVMYDHPFSQMIVV